MKVLRALLAILVGLSLTLICQGHEVSAQHTGPHVSLLGENNVGHTHHAHQTSEAGGHVHTEHTGHGTTGREAPALSLSSSTPFNLQQNVGLVSPTISAAQSVDTLSMQVAIIFTALCFMLKRYPIASGGQPLLGTGTGSPPDHPPPRYFSLSPTT